MEVSLFDLASGVDLKAYLEKHHGVEWRKNFATDCPFCHGGKNKFSAKSKDGKEFAHCFLCEGGGDLIKIVRELNKLPRNIEAAKLILRNEGIAFADDEELSDEQKAEIAAAQERQRKAAEAARKKRKEQEEAAAKATADEATKLAPVLAQAFLEQRDGLFEGFVRPLFPNWSPLLDEWSLTYLGFDAQHESIAILNRDAATGRCHNIKHRTKKQKDGTPYGGKWISLSGAKTAPFPLDYFRSHDDNRVIVCEGEKDALNLLSYGVNVLTLGGVSTRWEGEHLELLRGKTVYIWFDHDTKHRDPSGNVLGGYPNAIRRFNEIAAVASDCFVTLFYQMNPLWPSGFDVSDWLSEMQPLNAEDIFKRIAFHSFRVNNSLIDDIGEFLESDYSEFKGAAVSKNFAQLSREILEETQPVRGELDDPAVEEAIAEFRRIRPKIVGVTPGEKYVFTASNADSPRSNDYASILEMIGNALAEKAAARAGLFADQIGEEQREALRQKAEKIAGALDVALSIKETQLGQYRQTHIADMVAELLRATRKLGYEFAKFRGILHIWAGTHFLELKDYEIADFVLQKWMRAAKIDFKKQLVKNSTEIIDNLLGRAWTLDGVRDDDPRRVLTTLNGTVIVSPRGKWVFKPTHEKKHGATNILPFEFKADATAPKWTRFLERILPDEDDRKTLMEFIGYTFLPNHNYETFLFLYGKSGANGKSTVLNVIKLFFGEENVSNLQLQQFAGHELMALNNRLLNIGAEIDPKGLNDGQISTLKLLVSSRDSLQINPKNKDPFSMPFHQKPKLVFSGNGKPRGGLDDGFFRRMLMLNFDQEIGDDEKIRDLIERFSDELAGIFNEALLGLGRLVSQGKFTRSAKMRDALEEYKDEVNQIRSYVKENLVEEPRTMVPRPWLYAHYKAWAESLGYSLYPEKNFFTRLREEMPFEDSAERWAHENLPQRFRWCKGVYVRSAGMFSFEIKKGIEMQTSQINIASSGMKYILELEHDKDEA